MKIAVCEGNQHQREQLAAYIRSWAYRSSSAYEAARIAADPQASAAAGEPKVRSLPTIHQYADAKAFLATCEKDGPFDLVFLDIDLSGTATTATAAPTANASRALAAADMASVASAPNTDGLHLARHLQIHDPHALIVFVTAHTQYVFEGYKVHAFDFLPKPVSLIDIERALDYASDREEITCDQMFLADTSRGIKKIAFKDIYYFRAQRQFAELYHTGGVEMFPTKFSSLIAKLSTEGFVSPHRSYLVNLAWIRSVKKDSLTLIDGSTIPVARAHQQEVVDAWLASH